MNHKFTLVTIAAVFALCSIAFAVDVFPNQPNINGAYNQLLNVISHLKKSKLGDAQKHVDQAIVDLSSAKTMLELSTNNKGTYRATAIKLCDEAKEALTATPPDLDKANDIANHALKEVNMAGHAGSHR